jgi:signal transduction histidine kinase
MDAPRRILVVDDEPRGVELLLRALRDMGEVHAASSGEEAWAIAQQLPVDLVISDQRMPGMSGVELLTKIADMGTHTGRVLLTGYADLKGTIDAINRGRVHAYLSKPCGPDELCATVGSVLERVHLQRENERLLTELSLKNVDLERSAESLREARLAADRANAAKTEFLANISHEIRTPLTAILGFADLLREGEPSTAERAELLEIVRRNGAHLLTIINDLLDLSTIESGKMKVQLLTCSPLEIVEDVSATMRSAAARKGIGFEVDYRWPIPEAIESDPIRLRQILINLLGNAIKFTESGRVLLALGMEDPGADARQGLAFEVTDTGIGIPAERLREIFEPFSQGDSSTTRRFGGTGLGLAVCDRLAKLLGGSIRVRSAPGAGSTFCLAVPAGSVEGAELLRAPPPRAARGRGERSAPGAIRLRARILLAEDGPDNRRLLTALLTRAGASVEVAENGRIAYEKALLSLGAGEPFDLVLMDMQMPELDGYGATARLRAAGYDAPIVALTAHAMEGERERCIAVGCDDFATKPVDRVKLLRMIETYTAKRDQN